MTPANHFSVATEAFEAWWADQVARLDGSPTVDDLADLKNTHRGAFLAGWAGGLENGMAEAGNSILTRIRQGDAG